MKNCAAPGYKPGIKMKKNDVGIVQTFREVCFK